MFIQLYTPRKFVSWQLAHGRNWPAATSQERLHFFFFTEIAESKMLYVGSPSATDALARFLLKTKCYMSAHHLLQMFSLVCTHSFLDTAGSGAWIAVVDVAGKRVSSPPLVSPMVATGGIDRL